MARTEFSKPRRGDLFIAAPTQFDHSFCFSAARHREDDPGRDNVSSALRAETSAPSRRRKTKRRVGCFSARSINRPPLRGLGRARALTRRIKAHPAYTAALGNLLGIVGPEDTTDLSAVAPIISGSDPARRDGVVQVEFVKLTSDGVNLNPEGFRGYSKRDGDADFVFLARDTATPYIDNRPLLTAGKPEIREYKAMFVLSDEEIGIFSHELVVNCAP